MFITGASSGFGYAFAEHALSRGYNVVAAARDVSKLQALVAHMTLAQKIGQMTQAEIKTVTPDDVRTYYLGSVLNGGGSWPGNDKHAHAADWLKLADAYYDASMATDMAIKVPMIWGTDAVHGHNNVYGATMFPHNIGLGATRDADLVKAIQALSTWGLWSPDLNATNVMWGQDGLVLLDWDRARWWKRPLARRYRARLDRSLRKLNAPEALRAALDQGFLGIGSCSS